jgi:hypothetical protein
MLNDQIDRADHSGTVNHALPAASVGRSPALRRYTMAIEPAGHPEARYTVIVDAPDDGAAYDQASDHAAAELPYHCRIAIAKLEKIGRSG